MELITLSLVSKYGRLWMHGAEAILVTTRKIKFYKEMTK